MALNSPTFLSLFLPVSLVFYVVGGNRYRNFFLLFFSLIFFIWGDPLYFPFIFGLALVNFLLLRGMQKSLSGSRKRARLLAAGVVINLASLLLFKILAAYGQSLLDLALQSGLRVPGWAVSNLPRAAHLPLGLSFLTFQAISMLVDESRQNPQDQPRFLPVFTYLLMFPKAIAGPIVRFRETARQIQEQYFSASQAAAGLRRFMLGFAKKALIADQLALITDRGIFNQPPHHIPTGIAWLVILSYTLQIYFDFSAYSDMAIGLGQVLGFDFGENFNYPYLSASISEFWRRWHISLSNWFRDYVFYPLERKRRSSQWLSQWLSQSLNILIVFLLTGLWHGITPPFIAWGLLHGAALALERGRFGSWLRNLWRPLQHCYALGVIMSGWVLFRSPSLPFAWNYLKTLTGFTKHAAYLPFSVFPPVSPLVWSALTAGVLFSFPIMPSLQKYFTRKLTPEKTAALAWAQNTLVLALFVIGIIVQAGTSYQPFLYGGF